MDQQGDTSFNAVLHYKVLTSFQSPTRCAKMLAMLKVPIL